MIRKYVITDSNKGIYYVDAESPQGALEQFFRGYKIQISISTKNSATHCVKLLNSTRNVENYYIVNVVSMNRKPKSLDYIEPMPKSKLQQIVKDFKAKGGIIKMDDDSERFLRNQNSEGVTLNDKTILLPKKPGRSAVYEELIHARQYEQNKNDGSYEQRLLCEIEAQEELIRRKEELEITDVEDKQTRLALKAYKKEYNEYKRRKG